MARRVSHGCEASLRETRDGPKKATSPCARANTLKFDFVDDGPRRQGKHRPSRGWQFPETLQPTHQKPATSLSTRPWAQEGTNTSRELPITNRRLCPMRRGPGFLPRNSPRTPCVHSLPFPRRRCADLILSEGVAVQVAQEVKYHVQGEPRAPVKDACARTQRWAQHVGSPRLLPATRWPLHVGFAPRRRREGAESVMMCPSSRT